MRFVLWTGEPTLLLTERPIPEVGPDDVRVRVHACGVCMTEVHFAEGVVPPSTPPPYGFGHEWSGIVDAVGSAVTSLRVGTPVAGATRGAFADYVVLPAARVLPLPPNVPLDAATFAEPLACCITSVAAAQPTAGATALVTGAGPMGQMVAQLARRAGVRVLVSEPDERRRNLARTLGAEAIVDPQRESVTEAVAHFTAGAGVDIAWESAGRPEPLDDCLAALREGGTAVMVGVNGSAAALTVPLYRFHRRQLTLRAIYGAGSLEAVVAAVALMPELDLLPLISHRFALERINDAFAFASSGQGLKVLVVPS